MTLVAIWLAFLLDLLFGDPYNFFHPIKCIGNFITFLQKQQTKWQMNGYLFGAVLWLATISITVFITWSILTIANMLHGGLYWVLWIYLSYTTLATNSLAFEARKVYNTLKTGTLEQARYQVSMIVGRDTTQLSYEEICNATVETVAENTCDGVVAPLLCLFIGGPILAMVYKAVNTLDSMVGYKTEKYKKIGYVSAKLDDLFNLIPARLTCLFLLLATLPLSLPFKRAFQIAKRDRYKHASPNSAFSEAVVAGALGVQLGGTHVYHGKEIYKPTIGDKLRQIKANDIVETIALLMTSATIALIIMSSLYAIIILGGIL